MYNTIILCEELRVKPSSVLDVSSDLPLVATLLLLFIFLF